MKEKKLSAGLVITALGVVYGDIGTSPLYSLKESFHHTHGIAVVEQNIFGVLSLIFWSLILIISLKYHLLILKADNNGEGGILALTSLISKIFNNTSKRLKVLTLFGLFGTALLYGDGIITPAISVLSAVEGLELISPNLHSYVVPITVIILIALFSIQSHGTDRIGKIFGPITLFWFLTLGLLGLVKVIDNPHVLAAVSPHYAIEFFAANGWKGFVVLGSVFLVVTGGEALYSDLGHFGRHPIDAAWFSCVLPCLLLNYFGQGALLLENPAAIKNPFFLLAPEWALMPLVILATMATVIASQALITGVYSITMQAVQLQYLPRMKIDHTSQKEIGQIYVSKMNWALMFCCIAVTISFGSSTSLAAAYGIAVTMTMLITTFLFYFVARYSWNWSNFVAVPLCVFFGGVELCYFGANAIKIVHGGWFPLVVGAIIFTVMTTWNKGRTFISERLSKLIMPIEEFINEVTPSLNDRIPGVGIYLTGIKNCAPTTAVLNYRQMGKLHEHVLFLFIETVDYPHVPKGNRVKLQFVGPNIHRLVISFGFMDVPDVIEQLKDIELNRHTRLNIKTATFFVGKEHLLSPYKTGMAPWREKLYGLLSKFSLSAAKFYHLPNERVQEVGVKVQV